MPFDYIRIIIFKRQICAHIYTKI